MHVLIAGFGRLGQQLAGILNNSQTAGLAQAGIKVSALRRSALRADPDLQFVRADLLDPKSLQQLQDKYHAIVYCPTPDQRTPESYQNTYVNGLSNLLDAVAQEDTARLIFVSSTAVYGQTDGSSVGESSPTAPQRFNGSILLQAEQLARQRVRHSCAIRLSGLYQGLPNRYLQQLDQPSFDKADLGSWTNRIHLRDAASLIVLLLQCQQMPSVINGTDNEPAQKLTVLRWLAQRHSIDSPILTYRTDTALPESGKRVSNALAKQLGFIPEFPDFRSGFATPESS